MNRARATKAVSSKGEIERLIFDVEEQLKPHGRSSSQNSTPFLLLGYIHYLEQKIIPLRRSRLFVPPSPRNAPINLFEISRTSTATICQDRHPR